MKHRLLSTKEFNKLPVSGFGPGGYYYKINNDHHFFPKELFPFLGKELDTFYHDDNSYYLEIQGPLNYIQIVVSKAFFVPISKRKIYYASPKR